MKWRLCKMPLLSVCVSLIFVTGCWDETDIGEMVPVLAIGIDLAKDNATEVSLEIPSVERQQRSGGGTGDTTSHVIHGRGQTFELALDDAEATTSRRLFLPHNMILLFSKRYAHDKGIKDVITMVERSPFFRETQLLAITNGSAADMIELPTKSEFVNAYTMRQLISSMGKTVNVDVVDVVNRLLNPSETALLPWLNMRLSRPEVDGSAVVAHGKLLRHLTAEETDTLMWAISPRRGKWVLSGGDAERIVRVISARPHIAFHEKGDFVLLTIDGTAQLARIPSGDKVTDASIRQLEHRFNQEIASNVLKVILSLQRDGLDAMEVATTVQRQDPKLWSVWRRDWNHHYSNLPIRVRSSIRIVRNGLSKNPAFDYGQNNRQNIKE